MEDGSRTGGKFGDSQPEAPRDWNLRRALGTPSVEIAQREVIPIFLAWRVSRQQARNEGAAN